MLALKNMSDMYYANFCINSWLFSEKMSEEQKVREEIIKNFINNPHFTYKRIAKIVKAHRNTVSKVIQKFKADLSCNRKPGTGKKNGSGDQNKAKTVVTMLKKNPNLSGRNVARKVGCSESFVRRTKGEAGLKTYKVQKVPDRNAAKNVEAKTRAQKLMNNFVKKYECCIMDDETYVLSDFSQLPGQEFYVADARGNVLDKFKTQRKAKFPKKFLVWQAICSCGKRSKIFVTTGTINTEIYSKECLQKRLLPFLRQHKVSTFFWPDLASCHYSKAVLDWYQKNNIVFVPREANPPNCPELRPIERYWALVKRELKTTQRVSKDVVDFRRKWCAASQRIKEDTVKALMKGVAEKVNNFIIN